VTDQAHNEKDQENEEQDPGDFGRRKGHYSKTKNAGDQSDYEEDQRVIQHGNSFLELLNL
jgi:hypothetical protein